MDLQRVAVHGLQVSVPASWEVVINNGDWQRGQLVLANADNIPVFAIAWRRGTTSPDWESSFNQMCRQLTRSHGQQLQSREAVNGGFLGRFTDRDQVMTHAAVVPAPGDQNLSVSLRQLLPDSIADLIQIIQGVKGFDLKQATLIPWCIHGLDFALPPMWRMTGLRHMIGLVRGVWFRQPKAGKRADQILIMRRFACAERLLAGQSLQLWVMNHLAPKDRWSQGSEDENGTLHAEISCPATTWLQRLRGKRRIKHVDAWCELDMDRLLVQEWVGIGTHLPCLRQPLLQQHDAP